MLYARARMYSPGLGRFISRDPDTGEEGSNSTKAIKDRLTYVQGVRAVVEQVLARRPGSSQGRDLQAKLAYEHRRLTAALNDGAVVPFPALSYRDGMNLYGAYLVPNTTDPSGKTIYCGVLSGFLAAAVGGSGAFMYCYDDCCPSTDAYVICLGVGGGLGGSGGLGGAIGTGCLSKGGSVQLTGQLAVGVVGGGVTVGQGGSVSVGGSVGIGGGGAVTLEGCYAF